jgi:hypothetical protein
MNGPANEDAADIGSPPPDFNPYLDDYSHYNILEMVCYYNESFGIIPADNHRSRVLKFRRFLTEF